MKPTPIKAPNIDFNEIEQLRDVPEQIIKSFVSKQDKILEEAVRANAIPPIKGVLTAGKLKWRGIKLIVQDKGMCNQEMWIEQRGVRISPIISTEFKTIYSDKN